MLSADVSTTEEKGSAVKSGSLLRLSAYYSQKAFFGRLTAALVAASAKLDPFPCATSYFLALYTKQLNSENNAIFAIKNGFLPLKWLMMVFRPQTTPSTKIEHKKKQRTFSQYLHVLAVVASTKTVCPFLSFKLIFPYFTVCGSCMQLLALVQSNMHKLYVFTAIETLCCGVWLMLKELAR